MRKFTLYSADRKLAFDLNNARAFATEPKGIGNKFNITLKEAETGRLLSNIKPEFEPISFDIVFNADGSSGYANYKQLLNFLAKCGKGELLLEVDDGITKKQCDIVLENAPKSEIDNDNVFKETFVFQRLTYWYEERTTNFSLQEIDANNYAFPLKFPFMFKGYSFRDSSTIINDFYEQAPLIVEITGDIANDILVYLEEYDTEKRVAEIALSRGNTEGTIIVINANNKKITIDDGVTIENGYFFVDKTKQSFLYLPQGRYKVGANITQNDRGAIKIIVRRYLLD